MQSAKPFYLLLLSVTGCSALGLLPHIAHFENTLISFPDYLFHILGILMGFAFYFSNKYVRSVIICISVLSCIFLYFKGYNMWVYKIYYGSFTGEIAKLKISNLQVQNTEGDTISLGDFRGKYVVVDCWYTYCGVCYKKIPTVQELYDKYKDNTEIVIFALHSRMSNRAGYDKETVETGSNILRTRMRLSLPCFSIDMDDPVLKMLGVTGYPTVLIFDGEGYLIFRGTIENAGNFIDKKLNCK
jgi:thiol-disulfide isomerase/thioredoxin